MKAHCWARESDAELTFRERHWLSDDVPLGFLRASEAGSMTKRRADCVSSWLFNSRRQALILLANNGLRLCGLTFEVTCPRRQDL